MAFPPHIQVAIKMLPHLIDCAKEKRRTSHHDLGQMMKQESRMFSRPLAFIRDEICAKHGLPPLTALVENKGKDIPGNSFCPSKLATLTPAEYAAYREEMVQSVYDYEKWDRALQGMKEMLMFA
jgi:hypothetical protein